MKKLFTLAALVVALFSTSKAQTVCDTLFNLSSPLDTPTVYFADTGVGAGYLSGNNIYGDFIKAEGFASVIGDSVKSAELFFGVCNIATTDTADSVKVYVWDNTGTSIQGFAGAPGNIIDSASLSLGQIAAAITYGVANQQLVGNLVNFTGHSALTTDTFYVGVVLPTNTGDTIALYTNIVPPGPDGNGWEYEANYISGSGNGWGSYNNDWGFTGGSAGNFIIVSLCGGVDTTTGIVELSNNQRVSVYPNPATDQLNLVWSEKSNAQVSVLDLSGNLISTFTTAGDMKSTCDVHNLAAGAYILRIVDKTSNAQQSMMFTKF